MRVAGLSRVIQTKHLHRTRPIYIESASMITGATGFFVGASVGHILARG